MASFQADGWLFDGNVIEPDVVRWPALGDLAGESDTQLDAALETLGAEREAASATTTGTPTATPRPR